MFVALVCLTATCGKDEKEEEKVPLATAFLELNTATDVSLIFPGDATEVTVALNANREVEASASADWVTPTVTAGAGNTATLKIAVAQSNAAKRRTATVTLATKLAEEGDRAATPLTISLEQGVHGLVVADLLDVVFELTGSIPSARDISPLANPVLDLPAILLNDGVTERCPKVWPVVSMNQVYGRNSAYFSGPSQTCTDVGVRNHKSSCAYRVDFVDYSTILTHYHKDDMASNTIIPLNALGQGIAGSISLEAIIKREADMGGTFIGLTSSSGTSLSVDAATGALDYYMDVTDDPSLRVASQGGDHDFHVRSGDQAGEPVIEPDRYYHIVATYDRPAGRMVLYIDGVKIDELTLPAGMSMRFPWYKDGNALGQWIGIGGDNSWADPQVIINGEPVHINPDGYENITERAYAGEVVIARMYGKVLTDAEVKILYDYEKP
jgi:hypothetical protein